MVVEAGERPQLLLADWIEVAADGLLLQQATVRAPEDTVAAADDACHKLALAVGIGNALAVDDGLRACRELRPECIEAFFDVCNLVERDRRTCIPFLAATAVTALDVAAEVLRQDVRVQDDIAHLDEVTKRLVAAHAV